MAKGSDNGIIANRKQLRHNVPRPSVAGGRSSPVASLTRLISASWTIALV